MTDKVQLIKAEIERLIRDLGEQRDVLLEELLEFINSLPEEPQRSIIDELQKLTNDSLSKETKESWNEFLNEPVSEEWIEELRTKLDSMSKEDFQKVMRKYEEECKLKEEPVSEDLENAAETYTNSRENKKFEVGEGYGMNDVEDAFKAGAKWQKGRIWKTADGDDLPEIDREVVALVSFATSYRVVFAHRPNPDGWDARNIDTGEITHYEPQLYDKGGWNQPHVLYWLDLSLPYEIK